jgi:two-component system nitrogen regulation sensor histidine kinase NtrY
MPIRDRLLQNRKNYRLILAGLSLVLLASVGLFYLILRGRDLPEVFIANRLLLFVLWYANAVLILIVSFVLLRNLIKILVERRHRALGSTFKFKLVATYIGLSLIPVLLLFAIATELIQGSMDRWFNTPIEPVLKRSNDLAQALYDQAQKTNLRAAQRVLAEIQGLDPLAPEDRPRLNRKLLEQLSSLQLDMVAVYEGTDFVHAALNPQAGIAELPEPDRSLLLQAATTGAGTGAQPLTGVRGSLFLAAVADRPALPPAALRAGGGIGPPTAAAAQPASDALIVVVGSLLPPELAEPREKAVQGYQAFLQLKAQKEDLRASHFLLFLMVTLVILLASSWTGIYLAKRVTVPIQALAEGTRRITGGDLDHPVEVEADDELGVLVDSFNRMTRELGANKELIEHNNRELVATNQRLAAERARIVAVLESVAAGVISIDSEGRILTCNSAGLSMLRQRSEEVVGRTLDEAWSDPERRRLAAVFRSAPEPRAVAERLDDRAGLEVHLSLGGEWKTFEAKVTELRDAAGASQGRVLVLEDLTELIKAQQLAAWSEAARRIAHEIKNPLTPIRLSAERILKKHRQGDETLGAAIEEGVEAIVREVLTLQGMVDEFSRFARMPRPRPARVDLRKLVGDTLQLYRKVKPGVEVESEVEAGAAEAWLDGEQIKRVLINLLDNAVEATEAPGRVEVRAAASDGRLEIQVSDTGRGIPPEAREKLFLPYFSTKGRGTGLGLAIVHRIVTDHQGTIRVEDNTPQGTVFTLELPTA